MEGAADDGCVSGPIDLKEAWSPKWRLAIETVARTQNLESRIHAAERLISERGDKSAALIPIRLVFTNKVHKQDKLSLSFDARWTGSPPSDSTYCCASWWCCAANASASLAS